ncbi:2,3-diketo-5-methylthio-1-phosphopentane phosphatase [Coemansia reversa NRRL 1564]|uniref:2,3-diketo-5-methylthio-1-phosphopentane phosphatase n=1 Tax=Coemansia reversa (strain ATCC 12441 / NRRL 1564) TaxID=763665 RepID=A0A2G5BKQ0_COERN|nr:2,3-diketo-5-methylthio-1-phosphopentane phosphatase [Coemansia reversa NRRL 1564]|eukprot:PIA19588.1 2,3-diketo-5-methylthio-1-phosphopentane phosphatase [Coemansia reversa NRRL 1564]
MTCKRYDIVLLDIEGTTTPISFVRDVLFPYVKHNIREFLETRWKEPQVQKHIQAIAKQANDDVNAGILSAVKINLDGPHADSAEVIRHKVLLNIEWQMKADRKIGALKALQGCIWRVGYESGQLQGTMFSDAVEAIRRWKAAGVKIYIYSSGSIEAQKLIFGFSDHGNLLQYISGHFDTTTGQKIDSSSYKTIADKIGIAPDRILFVSDIILEVSAANQAGMQTVLSVRPGNAPVDAGAFETSSNFMTIPLNSSKASTIELE